MSSVSVAMATYNGGQFIRQQLESISAQTVVPAELVVTDDNSNDDTLTIIDAFAKIAPFPVRVHQNASRLGYRANFMKAANLCTSELIAFCDQDNYWYRHKVSSSVRPFDDPEVLLSYHDADVVTANDERIGSLKTYAAKQSILAPMSSGPWRYALGFTEIFRRSLLDLSTLWASSQDQHEWGQPLAHDQWVFFLAAVFGKIAYLDQPLTAYVQHGGNAYGWRRPQRRKLNSYFRDRSDELLRFAASAKSRAAILDTARNKVDDVWRKRGVAAAERYIKLSLLYGRRNSLHSAAHFSDRLEAFLSIVGKGGYGGEWSIGIRSFFTDLFIGVPLGPLARSDV